MNRTFASLLGLLGLLAAASSVHAQAAPLPTPPPSAQASPTGSMTPSPTALDFHAALTPYGTWRTLAPYGEVWVPKDLPSGWRPYTTGHWVFADAVGWTWVDDAAWGWAPFHYGRWTQDASLGWVWIPGDTWAPAWVAWRECDGFVGWAPLPPSAVWRPGIGLTFVSMDPVVAIGLPCWSFVPVGHFCHPRLTEVLLAPERVKTVFQGSHLVHGVALENGHVVNRAIAVDRIEKSSNQLVKRVFLRDVDGPEKLRTAPMNQNEVAVFRPQPSTRAMASHATAVAHAPAQMTPHATGSVSSRGQTMHQHHHWHYSQDGKHGTS